MKLIKNNKIKISIITPCLNSDKSIAYTLYSVFKQSYKNYEHIIVDGGSDDQSLNIIKKHRVPKKIYSLKGSTIYEAINLGIKKATGDYILILNSDDILNDNNVLKDFVKNIFFNNLKKNIYLGSVIYFHNQFFNKVIRYYSPYYFQSWMLILGNMPPHPGALIPAEIAKKNIYNTEFKIAADFDLFVKLFLIKKYPFKKINLIVTRMRTGGVSGLNLLSHVKSGLEVKKSLSNNNIFSSHLLVNFRYITKLMQFFNFQKYHIIK